MTELAHKPKYIVFKAEDSFSPLFWDDEDVGIGDANTLCIGNDEFSMSALKGLKEWRSKADKYDPYSDVATFTTDGMEEWISQGYAYARQLRKMIPLDIELYFAFWHRLTNGKWVLWKSFITKSFSYTQANPMPMTRSGIEPDWLAATPESVLRYLYGEMGLSRNEVANFLCDKVYAASIEHGETLHDIPCYVPPEEKQTDEFKALVRVHKRALEKYDFWLDVLRKELSRRLCRNSKGQLRIGFDPELFERASELAVRCYWGDYVKYVKYMLKALGEPVRPYLQVLYDVARWIPNKERDAIEYANSHRYEVSSIDVLGCSDFSFFLYSKQGYHLPIWTDEPKPLTEGMVWDSLNKIIKMQVEQGGEQPYEMAWQYRGYFDRGHFLPKVKNEEEARDYRAMEALCYWLMNASGIKIFLKMTRDIKPIYEEDEGNRRWWYNDGCLVCKRLKEEEWEFLDMYNLLENCRKPE